MISRRKFLSFASIPLALSTELAVPKPLRKIFLPPAAGWVAPYARIPAPELLLKGLTVEDAYAPEIASGAIRYDAAAGMLELWKEPDPIREAAEREASIIRHREGREILGVARDGRAAEDDAIDSAAAEAAMAASLAALRETRPIEHPMNYVPDAMLRGKRIYVATSKFEFERAVMAQECAIEWMKTHPNDPYFEEMSGIESARVVVRKPCYERHVSMANWNPNYSPR